MKSIFVILLLLLAIALQSQESDKIQEIIKLGEEWKFEEAIDRINEELKTDPTNAELYYWLGRYSHYMVYDTRPFSNKSDNWSDEQILKNLYKAVKLNPKFGDAKYFLAAEYGARSYEALKSKDIEQYKKELINGNKSGGFPAHAIEYGRNILKSCDKNAILFATGDADVNILQYVQAVEGYRQDVSIVIIAFLERPFYISLIRDGIPGILRPVPCTMSDNLIMEMHNYKWKANDILIPISERAQKQNKLDEGKTFVKWHVKPDVGKNKLWSGKAMIMNILEANKFERPVHCTQFTLNQFDGLQYHFQTVGLTKKLLPYSVYNSRNRYNSQKFETLMLDPDNYTHFQDIKENNQPRASIAFGQARRISLIHYASYLVSIFEYEKAKEVLKKMGELMPEEYLPYMEYHKNQIEKLNTFIEKSKT